MNNSFTNYEIVLISNNTEDAQWILKALKRSHLNNELIWLKDIDRTFDYLTSDGLYTGKEINSYTKVFIIDSNFPESDKVRNEIMGNCKLKDCKVLTLAESKEEFFKTNESSTHGMISELFGKMHAFSMAFFF